jgi:iron uptake system EfeUOB component EfeO/EfeM
MAKEELTKLEKELIQVAYANMAVARVTKLYSPPRRAIKGRQEWDEYADTMTRNSEEFVKAIKAGDLDQIKSTASNTCNACENCHGISQGRDCD